MEIKPITRNGFGLIEGVDYPLIEDGSAVDWRRLVKPEYLVPNKQVFIKRNQEVPASIKDIEDKDLLILLQGIKELCRLRGFLSISQVITTPSVELVACVCQISWMPNFETEGKILTSAGAADATPKNTSGFGNLFLTAIAENRAFVRCVRNFLGIKIIGQDEITPQGAAIVDSVPEQAAQPMSPIASLEAIMKEKNVSFGTVKDKLILEKCEGAEEFTSVSDIPPLKIFEILERLKRKKA
jgi:hypothetical protein